MELDVKLEKPLTLLRICDAAPAAVFEAWTNCRRLSRWWGPKGYSVSECEIDPHAGGAIRIVALGPDAARHTVTGIYREFMRPERLVFSGAALDPTGEPFLETMNTVTFTPYSGQTMVTVEVRVTRATGKAEVDLAGMEQGWTEALGKLAGMFREG